MRICDEYSSLFCDIMFLNILTQTLLLMICSLIFLCSDVAHGKDEGIHNSSCLLGCSCCKNKTCGPKAGAYWPDGNCYEGCIDGYRGARCAMKCRYPECAACDTDASICTKCTNGYYPGPATNCSLKCPLGCESCTSSTHCTKCKENYYNGPDTTDCRYSYCPQNCKCENAQCLLCRDGFYNTTTKCNSKCPDNCITCTSKTSCDSCKDGYFNRHSLDNSTISLLNNCTDKCREHCTVCSSYDQCLQCKPGKYGSTCQNDCSPGCKDGSCTIKSGHCDCTENYSGANCHECIAGKHGAFCEEKCSEYCKYSTCNKTTGHCIDGCISNNMTGSTCHVCISGLLGVVCNVSCPENCKDSMCDRDSGDCISGCQANFVGRKCETCVSGKYGKACNLYCPKNCKDEKCDKVTGNCISCIGNFAGDNCEHCTTGFYGQTCDNKCSSGCFNNTCKIKTGDCISGCKDGFSGDRCCVENNNCYKCSSNTTCGECKSSFYSKLCDKECSQTCVDSCEFETGKCNNCTKSIFGSFCNYQCPANCTKPDDINERLCELSDGRCLNGCVNGLFGPWCTETCSSFCADDVCEQDTGKCTKGCYAPRSDPICFLSSGTPEEMSQKTQPVAAATLGSILCISVTINFIFISRFVYRKIGQARRKSVRKETREISFENIAAENETNNTCTSENSAYECINNAQGLEHEYHQMKTIKKAVSGTELDQSIYLNLCLHETAASSDTI